MKNVMLTDMPYGVRMRRRRKSLIPGVSFSWRRATGLSAAKGRLSRKIGIPLTPVRLKCALLGLSTLKLALHKAKGTPLPEEWAGATSDLDLR